MTKKEEKVETADAFTRKVLEAKVALDEVTDNFYRTMFKGLGQKVGADERELMERIAKNLWDTNDALYGLARRFENDES
jgi:molecular chaperone DnaK (HSP70)